MPSSSKAREALFALLPERRNKIFELGSGWGHLAFPLAKQAPSSYIQAYEGSWLPWLFSVFIQAFLRRPNLRLIRKNFYTTSLKEADLIICYLYPGAMRRLKEKFEKELKPGTVILSNTFAIPGWRPERVETIKDFWNSQIYLYRVPQIPVVT